MIEFLDPKNRQEVLICCAGVALHGLLAGSRLSGAGVSAMNCQVAVYDAFAIAQEFLKQAEALPP